MLVYQEGIDSLFAHVAVISQPKSRACYENTINHIVFLGEPRYLYQLSYR